MSSSPAPPVSILLVDDRPDKIMALESILLDLGQNLVLAPSGKEALRCLLRQDFAVILLDVNMPIMDGFETAALIRQRRSSETTPIIFVSAINDTDNHLSRGYSLGAVDYILTPVVPEILRAKVSVFVDLFNKTEQVKRQGEERAEFIREQAARAEAEAAQTRFAFLSEASRALAASLDSAETFRNVSTLAVPTLADLCLVHTLDKDGTARLAAAHSVPPGVAERTRQVRRRYPLGPELDYYVPRVLRTGETELRNDVADDALLAAGWTPEHRALLRELDVSAYLVVPLVARERTIGALSLVFTGSRRLFAPAEVALAEELAGRAALAVDSAALYAAAHEARDAAEAANNAKDHFLATLSHELRTPLSPVINTVQLLEQDESLPEGLRPAIEMIRRNVELEARLIDDLLDLTRVSKGKVRLSLDTLDAHHLVQTGVEICQDEITAKCLHVSLELSAGEPFLRGDAARLQQVIWNLLKNAVKFTPEGGRITVRSRNPTAGQLRIEVADTGIGIPPELLPKIFDAFEQGARHGQGGGLGLGLAIAKALVDLHEGTLRAASAGPGRGAVFTLSFPTVRAPAPVGPAEHTPVPGLARPTTPDATNGENGADHILPRLLLVDDHPDTLRSMKLLLTRRGYQVSTAPDVRSALETAAESRFDLLISDVGLPDGSGMDLMRQLRSTAGGDIPGIALSGYGMEEDVARSHAAGFLEHLTKPVDTQTLEAAIQRLLVKA